jgi:hypothetical protein
MLKRIALVAVLAVVVLGLGAAVASSAGVDVNPMHVLNPNYEPDENENDPGDPAGSGSDSSTTVPSSTTGNSTNTSNSDGGDSGD